MKKQLKSFTDNYSETYLNAYTIPNFESWNQVFKILTEQLEKQRDQKHILFFDELPWLTTRRSNILSEIDYFWNTKWSRMPNIILIVCGSAASWMIRNIVNAKGGLYNRLTNIIHLYPFTLSEFKDFLNFQKVKLTLFDLVELYLALGGVPHYLKMFKREYSVAQNINNLFFEKNAQLKEEYSEPNNSVRFG